MPEPLFQRGSTYQQHRPGYPDSLFLWLAQQCPERARALDLGCGTGQACRGLEPWFKQVIGADLSLPQLLAAPTSQTHYLASSASSLPLADDSLNLITVAQAFHWFDQPRFFAEAQRCLRSGGLLALVSYGLCEVDGLRPLIRDYHNGALGPWWPKERATLLANYPDATLPWARVLHPGDVLECQWRVADMLGYLDTWSALVRARKAGEDPLATLRPVLTEAWGPAPRTVRWPLRVKAWRRP